MNSPLNDLSFIRTKLDEFDAEETQKYGAPLKDFILVIPAAPDASNQLIVRAEFEIYYYQAKSLGMTVQLDPHAFKITRIRDRLPFLK